MSEKDSILVDHINKNYVVKNADDALATNSSLIYTSDSIPPHAQRPFEHLDEMIQSKNEGPVSIYTMKPSDILKLIRDEEREDQERPLYDELNQDKSLTLEENPAPLPMPSKDETINLELTERTSEIIKDLGKQNEYDKTAMLAQISAKTYFDFELLRMGTHLSHLVQTIPYDSDKFYKVIALKRNIEIRLELLKRLETFKDEIITVPENTHHSYAFSLYKLENNTYQIGIDLWSSAFLEDPSGLGNYVRSKVIDYLEKQFHSYRDERTYDSYAGARDEIDTYYDEKDRPVYYYRYHKHSAGGNYGIGYHNELTVYENSVLAVEIWENVKNIIEKSIREHSTTNISS